MYLNHVLEIPCSNPGTMETILSTINSSYSISVKYVPQSAEIE